MATAAQSAASGSTTTTASQSSPDLDEVKVEDLPQEIQDMVKGFKSDYTKKTQSLAKDRKDFETTKEESDKWKTWYTENETGIDEFSKWKETQANATATSTTEPGEVTPDALAAYGQKLADIKKDTSATVNQAYIQIRDLTKVSATDPEADWDKIIEVARKEGLTDMRKAYNICYQEKLTKKEVDEAVKSAKKDWEEKEKLNVLSTEVPSGRQTRKIIKPDQR